MERSKASPSLSQKKYFQIILRRSFWNFYDHLGLWISLGIISFLLSLSIFLIPFVISALLQMSSFCFRQKSQKMIFSSYFICLFRAPIRPLLYISGLLLTFVTIFFLIFFYLSFFKSLFWLKFFTFSFLFWVEITLALLSPLIFCLSVMNPSFSLKKIFRYALFAFFSHPFVFLYILILNAFTLFLCTLSVLGLLLIWLPLSAIFTYNFFYIFFKSPTNTFDKTMSHWDNRSFRDF
ncbi:hypothetical protein AB834_04280 [PVC group bacterium (ex Bugula neritina AB1)]|nr:hypothetical protein AB834_04280 [PVC group bacterium (ex Bugula neritina AB1)]